MQEFIYHEEGVYLAPQAVPITYVLKESKIGTHCWHCISHYSDGKVNYPRIFRNGVRIRLSRYMYEREVTRIPDGYYILHACDNPFCINPDHLYAGTAKDNTQDAILKGRFKPFGGADKDHKGENNPNAVLSEETVKGVYTATGTYKQIASRFNISVGRVGKIKRQENWASVTDGLIKGGK